MVDEDVPSSPPLGRTSRLRFLFGAVSLVVLAGLALGPLLERGAVRAAPAAPLNDRLGLVFVNGPGYDVPDERYQQAVEAGAGWTRWPFYWQEIEPQSGIFDYSEQDAVVTRDLAHGLKINGILFGTPGWTVGLTRPAPPGSQPRVGDAAAGGPPPETKSSPMGIPGNLDQPVFLPDGQINPLNFWARYVYTTVSRYKGKITVWEIWNEPDWPGWFWTGTVADYYRLLQVGYLAAKKADPNVTVLMAGLCHWCGDPDFFTRLTDLMAADPTARENDFYFDALPLHIYVNPYYIFRFVNDHRRDLAKLGITKPLWINEANISVCGDTEAPLWECPSPWRASLNEQSTFMIQIFALAAGLGIQRTLIFQMYDDGIRHEHYGLIRNNGVPRPAYFAFQTAARYLNGYRTATIYQRPEYDTVTFTGGPEGRVTVVWNNTDKFQTTAIEAQEPRARLVDKYGQATSVTPIDGKYRLLLRTASNFQGGRYYIGGDPLFLIETPATPTPTPTATVSGTVTIDGVGPDGGQAAPAPVAELASAEATPTETPVPADVTPTVAPGNVGPAVADPPAAEVSATPADPAPAEPAASPPADPVPDTTAAPPAPDPADAPPVPPEPEVSGLVRWGVGVGW